MILRVIAIVLLLTASWAQAQQMQMDMGNVVQVTPGGQWNLVGLRLLPQPTGMLQQIGASIEMRGGIPLYLGNQTGGALGVWGLNLTLQQNAADPAASLIGVEANLNSNKAAATLEMWPPQVLFSAVSDGQFPAGIAYSVSGMARWVEGVQIATGSIIPGGYAFRYKGDGAHGDVAITHDSKLQLGFISGLGAPGEIHMDNRKSLQMLNATRTDLVPVVQVNGSDDVLISPGGYRILMGGPVNAWSYSAAGLPGLTRVIQIGGCTLTITSGLITGSTC